MTKPAEIIRRMGSSQVPPTNYCRSGSLTDDSQDGDEEEEHSGLIKPRIWSLADVATSRSSHRPIIVGGGGVQRSPLYGGGASVNPLSSGFSGTLAQSFQPWAVNGGFSTYCEDGGGGVGGGGSSYGLTQSGYAASHHLGGALHPGASAAMLFTGNTMGQPICRPTDGPLTTSGGAAGVAALHRNGMTGQFNTVTPSGMTHPFNTMTSHQLGGGMKADHMGSTTSTLLCNGEGMTASNFRAGLEVLQGGVASCTAASSHLSALSSSAARRMSGVDQTPSNVGPPSTIGHYALGSSAQYRGLANNSCSSGIENVQ